MLQYYVIFIYVQSNLLSFNLISSNLLSWAFCLRYFTIEPCLVSYCAFITVHPWSFFVLLIRWSKHLGKVGCSRIVCDPGLVKLHRGSSGLWTFQEMIWDFISSWVDLLEKQRFAGFDLVGELAPWKFGNFSLDMPPCFWCLENQDVNSTSEYWQVQLWARLKPF